MTPTTRRSSRVRFALYGFVVLGCLALVAALVFRHAADPIARRRILRSVQERLGTPATLDEVHVTFRPGLHVTGRGLHIAGTGTQPSIDIRSFAFATHLSSLFDSNTTLVSVDVDGLSVTIPPGRDDAPIATPPTAHTHGRHGDFMVAQVDVTGGELIIQNADTSKYPLLLHIARMTFDDPGAGKPIHFEATLSNPSPIGDVHAHGLLGPCNPQRPRETPLSGRFDFANGDLSSIAGVQGHLHGEGTLTGSIGLMVVDGDASMPDFAIAPGLLHTKLTTHFHAAVDALTGQVTLTPVSVHVLHTNMTAHGTITRLAAGHDVALNTELQGRAEDLLNLVSPTRGAPLFTAALEDHATFHIPPGRERMLLKLSSAGQATLTDIRWSDPDVRQKVDSLTTRAEGNPKRAKESPLDLPDAPSTLTDTFLLSNGQVQLNGIVYRLPGTTVLMDGTYNLTSETLDSHGVVRTASDASHMTTGIKSLLLKPLNPFLRKPGAGMQLPISLTGPKDSLKLALDLGNHKADDKLAPAAHK